MGFKSKLGDGATLDYSCQFSLAMSFTKKAPHKGGPFVAGIEVELLFLSCYNEFSTTILFVFRFITEHTIGAFIQEFPFTITFRYDDRSWNTFFHQVICCCFRALRRKVIIVFMTTSAVGVAAQFEFQIWIVFEKLHKIVEIRNGVWSDIPF